MCWPAPIAVSAPGSAIHRSAGPSSRRWPRVRGAQRKPCGAAPRLSLGVAADRAKPARSARHQAVTRGGVRCMNHSRTPATTATILHRLRRHRYSPSRRSSCMKPVRSRYAPALNGSALITARCHRGYRSPYPQADPALGRRRQRVECSPTLVYIVRVGFEWSEAKRLAVLDARRLDFLDGCRLFDGRRICTAPSPRSGEQRWVSIGELNGEMIAVV